METEIVSGSFGLGLLTLAGILWFLRRTNYFRWCIDTRKAIIEDCSRTGNKDKARRLAHEIEVFEKRLPLFSRLLGLSGLLLIAISFVLHLAR